MDEEVFCHVCNVNTKATLNETSQEYCCNICGSNFVEILNEENGHGQTNVTQPGSNSDTNDETQGDTGEHNQIIQQMMNNFFASETFNNIRNNNVPGRTVVVIRQSPDGTQSTSVNNIGDNMASNFGLNDLPLGRGIFNLLNSIHGIRQPSGENDLQFEQLLHHILMNENSHAGAPPASEDIISKLPKEIVSSENVGECSITQELFEIGETIIALPCGHKYKQEPIVHWLKMHNSCPVCRVEVTTE